MLDERLGLAQRVVGTEGIVELVAN